MKVKYQCLDCLLVFYISENKGVIECPNCHSKHINELQWRNKQESVQAPATSNRRVLKG